MSRRTLWVLGVRLRFLFIKNRMCAPGLLFKPFRALDGEASHQPHSGGAKSTFKAQGFKTPSYPIELKGDELLQVLRGPNDERKSGLIHGLRLFGGLLSMLQFPPRLQGAIHRLPSSASGLNSEGIAPLVVSADISITPEDCQEIGGMPAALSIERLCVTLEVRWGVTPGYIFTQFQTADGRDFAKAGQDATKVVNELWSAIMILQRATETALRSARSPRAEAWSAGEEPRLDDTELYALDLVADFRFESMTLTPEEHVHLKADAKLGDGVAPVLTSLVSKGCIERIQCAEGSMLDLTPTGLLACTRGGDAGGLAMGVLSMIKRQVTAQGSNFSHFTWESDVRHLDCTAIPQHPFAAAVIDILRLAMQGSWGPWLVADRMSLVRVGDLRLLRLRAEKLRREDATARVQAASPAKAPKKKTPPTAPSIAKRFGDAAASFGAEVSTWWASRGRGTGTCTILFLASNPATTVRLAIDVEARDIQNTIQATKHRDSFSFKTRWAVRTSDLNQALNDDQPTVVHFSGHGSGAEGIVLQDDNGHPLSVGGPALRNLFKATKGNIRVVVLNVCDSTEQAKAISEVVDCVIGMGPAVKDAAARKFAAAFYQALGSGKSVKNAFKQGVAAIDVNGLSGGAGPELFERKGVKAKDVRLVS